MTNDDRYARACALLDKWSKEDPAFDKEVGALIEEALRESSPRHFPPEPIVWTGDEEDDDWTARWNSMILRAEALGTVRMRNITLAEGGYETDSEQEDADYYYVAVYRGDETLFHSDEHGGYIMGLDMAKAVAEAVARGCEA